MPAYVLADIEVHDAALYERYRELAAASVARYGGRYVLRGPAVAPLEGEWPLARIVLLEFDDEAALRRWYDSPEYREAAAIRERAAAAKLAILTQ